MGERTLEQQTEEVRSARRKISPRNWLIIWIVGITGQLCWSVENSWFNTFVYDKIGPYPWIITWMTAVSAITMTVCSLLCGCWSDRVGRRKPFMIWGYIIWGAFTILFGAAQFVSGTVLALGVFVIVADGLMSMMGAIGGDAGFGPWAIDISDRSNRGTVGAATTTQPVIATILCSLIGGWIIGAIDYFAFFLLMGVLVMLLGVFNFFLVQDAPDLRPNRDPKGFWHQFIQVFNFRLMWKNRMLIAVWLIFIVYLTGFHMYFTHIMNYFIYTRGYSEGMAGVIFAVGLIVAIPTTLLAAKQLNRFRFAETASVTIGTNILGIVMLGLTSWIPESQPTLKLVCILVSVAFVGAGYMCTTQALSVWAKNLYPDSQRGQLEGLRTFVCICVPMVVGPILANFIINTWGADVVINGNAGKAASQWLYFGAAIVSALAYIPIAYARKLIKAGWSVERPPEDVQGA